MPKTSDDELTALMEGLGFEWLAHDQQWYRTLPHKVGDFQGKARGQYVHPELASFLLQAINAKYIRRDIVAAALGGNNHAIREARRELGLEDTNTSEEGK